MNKYWGYIIQAYWGPRRETPEQLGLRFMRMLDALAPIDPLFRGWEFFGATKPWPMPSGASDELTRLVAECVARAEDGGPSPIAGYQFGAATRTRAATALSIDAQAGRYAPNDSFLTNTVELTTNPLNEDNAALITLPIFKSALLAIATAWDATWCAAYPAGIIELWPNPGPGQPHFNMAWITYLSPRFAPMVTPPHGILVEHTPQGGIVMITTKDRFDVSNELHLAAARRIKAAIAPVNALPWPPDAYVSNR
jgi:hypothetical protein